MVPNADKMGSGVTKSGDPRVTQIGKLLRRYKLDELPQLFNVLLGDLSLVGARPESPRYVEMFRTSYDELLRDRPGITDPASLAFRNEEELLAGLGDLETAYVNEVLPRKLHLSLEYARRRTFLTDLGILFQTVYALFRISAPPSAVPGTGSTQSGSTPQ